MKKIFQIIGLWLALCLPAHSAVLEQVNTTSTQTLSKKTIFEEKDVRSYADLAAAVTSIGSTEATLVIPTDQACSTAITSPSTLTVKLTGSGKVTKSAGCTLTFNGPFEAPLKQVFSGFAAGDVTGLKHVYPQWFGAKFDDATDDSTAWATAIAAISVGEVRFTAGGVTRIGTGLTFPAGKVLHAEGMRASKMTYTGTSGYALTFGSTTASAMSYGTGARDFQLNLTQNGGNGIRLAGTSGAYLENIYIEGIPSTNTSTAVWIDGAVASNLFTQITNVDTNHFKFGFDLSSSGVGQTTSAVIVNAEAFCDLIAGSIGINIAASNGNGVRFIGGNVENCAQGIKTDATNTSFFGMRYEGNTADIRLEATAQLNTFIGGLNLQQSKISDTSSHRSNVFLANQAPNAADPIPTNMLPDITLKGDLTLFQNPASNRYIFLDNTTTGSLVIQAGIGSGALGGAIVLRGSSHAGNGSVIAGLGGSGARNFCVNTDGQGTGTNLFCVDASGFISNVGVLFSALGTPSNGTMVYCSDCAIANPCAGAGTGAFAKRLNGAWICN